MALDTAPPLGSWVSVYGQQAWVTSHAPSTRSYAAAVRVEFPPEVDLAALNPQPSPLTWDGGTRTCWVSLREPTLHTIDSLLAEIQTSLTTCTLTGTAAQFTVLRAALESARLLLIDAGPQLSPALAVVDQFLDQLPVPEPADDRA